MERSADTRVYRQGSFIRVFAGQLILLVFTATASAWIASAFGWSGLLAASLALVAASALSLVGSSIRGVSELRISPDGIDATRYLARPWASSWGDLSCVLVFESPTFGARYRLKIVAREAGSIIVTDLVDDFEGLIRSLREFAPGTPPCRRPTIIERLLTGG